VRPPAWAARCTSGLSRGEPAALGERVCVRAQHARETVLCPASLPASPTHSSSTPRDPSLLPPTLSPPHTSSLLPLFPAPEPSLPLLPAPLSLLPSPWSLPGKGLPSRDAAGPHGPHLQVDASFSRHLRAVLPRHLGQGHALEQQPVGGIHSEVLLEVPSGSQGHLGSCSALGVGGSSVEGQGLQSHHCVLQQTGPGTPGMRLAFAQPVLPQLPLPSAGTLPHFLRF